MIEAFDIRDLDAVMELWLAGNQDAHPFLPAGLWKEHYPQVKELLPQAELLVYRKSGNICGFVGLEQDYIAGLFVSRELRSQGIGKQLLEACKERRSHLELHVFTENVRAVAFYQSNGFTIAGTRPSEMEGQPEHEMIWNKD